MTSRFFTVHIFVIMLALADPFAASSGDFDFPPVYFDDYGKDYSYQKGMFGPFISVRKDDQRSAFGLRPLFFWQDNKESRKKELDILYPCLHTGRKIISRLYRCCFI